GLLSQINTVQRQDSLQRIAALPEKERDDYIKKLARQLRRQRGLAEESTTPNTNPAAAAIASKEDPDLFRTSGKGEWYFYNENTRTQGEAAFKRIWGKRPNVDNWRRYSDVVAQLQNTIPDNTRGNAETLLVDETVAFSYDGLLKNIPLTEDALQQSNDSIAAALYTAGRIYTDKLEDYESAIKSYESLRQRFPAFQSMEEVLFQLFYSYTKTGNAAKAAEIKAVLAEKYPDGHYTNSAATGKKELETTAQSEATKAYEGVYDLFLAGRFEEAKNAKAVADSLYGTTVWASQLLYIEAVYHIKQHEDSLAKNVLETLIQQSGDAPISQKATTLMDVLARRHEIEQELTNLQIERPLEDTIVTEPKPVVAAKTNRMATDTVLKQDVLVGKSAQLKRDTLAIKQAPLPSRSKVFTYQPAEAHFAVVVLNNVDAVFGNEAKNAFTRYNREKYYNRPLNLDVIPLTEVVKLVTIGTFANIQDAVDYVQKAKQGAATEIIPWLKKEKYSFSIISESNLLLLQENHDLKGYQLFFDKNLPVKF
ncbi:MAG TPA: hypothetical protein VM010_08050, partial [Chitinophagaceae bacterium]|nr:hypothetical protein [Chitinophagaceae bacterium]